jgi:hypothetical protein
VFGFVDPPRWCPFGYPVGVDAAVPAFGGEVVMVVAAEQGQVVQISLPAVDPGHNVMAFGPFWWGVAAGEGASDISGDQGDGLAAAGDAAGPAESQHLTVAGEERVVEVGLVGQVAGGVGADQGAVGGDAVAGVGE